MVKREALLIQKAKDDPRYGTGQDFEFSDRHVVGFGGEIGGSKNWSALDRTNPILNSKTYDVATNPLTWSVRNASITSIVSVHDNGNYIYIENYLYDTWDLSAQKGRPLLYNIISGTGGFFYHDVFGGNSNMQTTASWSSSHWMQ
ncbi:MAG: hypothetical protein JST42_12185 [Bacteroidetes bacterium]|nr:hypothetical protein [Bacteroidota bacterium]